LQPRDARLKTGVAALAVVQSLFQPFGKHPAFTGYGFIKLLVLVGRQAVIPTGVKVIAVTPEVCEVRYPLPAHKASLLVEKFAVETFAAPRSRTLPFPRTVHIIRKPQLRWAKFLDGEAVNLIPKEGQKAVLLNSGNQVIGTMQLSDISL